MKAHIPITPEDLKGLKELHTIARKGERAQKRILFIYAPLALMLHIFGDVARWSTILTVIALIIMIGCTLHATLRRVRIERVLKWITSNV